MMSGAGNEAKAAAADSKPAITLRPARAVRAVEDITEQIRGELRAGRLLPGQRLPPERDLAAQLGVSRSTIREAMGMLEVAGIVERRIGSAGGSFITASNSAVVARSISDGITLGCFSLTHLAEARLAPLIQKTAEVAKQLRFSGNDGIIETRRKLVASLRARDPDAAARNVQEGIDFIYKGWLTRSATTTQENT